MKRGEELRRKLSTVFSEYAPRVHSATEEAENRLIELEDRDAARARREDNRSEELREKYDSMGG